MLDDVEAMYVREGSFLRDWGLELLGGIKAKEASGASVSGMSLGQLITGLDGESERDAVRDPARALRKVELGLRAAQEWRGRFETWTTIVLKTEGSLYMTRWFLRGDPEDRKAALAKYAASDDAESRAEWRGSGRYFLGAKYQTLASWARETGRPRDEQIALIDAGIAANKAGREKYPFDSIIGLNLLYGGLSYVSGGSALGMRLDEWQAYMRTQPRVDQARSGAMLAEALFQFERDEEALPWFDLYAGYWAVEPVKPELRESELQTRCLRDLRGDGFRAYARRDPARFAVMRDRLCAGKA
ncbi:MAG TPA: hypothetical protein VF555_17690 [Variovorax sp.]